MGTAVFAGKTFRIDPTSIRWEYEVKSRSIPTVGGKVIQVFGGRISDMVVEGEFGVGGWEQQAAFLDEMKAIGADQAAMARFSRTNRPPHKFIYPPKGWNFDVYLKAFSNPDGPRSVALAPEIKNPKWRLIFFIVEDNSGLRKVAQDAYIARIAKGIGWRLTEYNGGNTYAEISGSGGATVPSAVPNRGGGSTPV